MTTAALVYGYWGQNIGNAFFNLGGAHALRTALGDENLKLVQDQPAYWTFRNERRGNYPSAYNLIADLDVDIVCMQGPLFTETFGSIWSPTLHELKRTGRSWVAIGAGLRKYSDSERSSVADVLRSYPPLMISTRDNPTYEFLVGLHLPDTMVRNGIDSAFFCPLVYDPPKLRDEPPIVLAFDHFPEPEMFPDEDGMVVVNDERFQLKWPRMRTELGRMGKATGIVSQQFNRHQPTMIAGTRVIRPRHRTNPHLPSVIYRTPGSVASDEPYTYLTIYANAKLTLSDRVHACVATLAYGGEAMLSNPTTRRSALFESVGCGSITSTPTTMDTRRIQQDFEALVADLCQTLGTHQTGGR